MWAALRKYWPRLTDFHALFSPLLTLENAWTELGRAEGRCRKHSPVSLSRITGEISSWNSELSSSFHLSQCPISPYRLLCEWDCSPSWPGSSTTFFTEHTKRVRRRLSVGGMRRWLLSRFFFKYRFFFFQKTELEELNVKDIMEYADREARRAISDGENA